MPWWNLLVWTHSVAASLLRLSVTKLWFVYIQLSAAIRIALSAAKEIKFEPNSLWRRFFPNHEDDFWVTIPGIATRNQLICCMKERLMFFTSQQWSVLFLFSISIKTMQSNRIVSLAVQARVQCESQGCVVWSNIYEIMSIKELIQVQSMHETKGKFESFSTYFLSWPVREIHECSCCC